jgi:hypothetical protein
MASPPSEPEGSLASQTIERARPVTDSDGACATSALRTPHCVRRAIRICAERQMHASTAM